MSKLSLLVFSTLMLLLIDGEVAIGSRKTIATFDQTPVRLNVQLYHSLVKWHDQPDRNISIALLRNGDVQATSRALVSRDGYASLLLEKHVTSSRDWVLSGDVIQVSVDGAAAINVVIPDLTADIGANQGTIVGTSPPGTRIELLEHSTGLQSPVSTIGSAIADIGGSFRFEDPTITTEFVGRARLTSEFGDRFDAIITPSRIAFHLGSARVTGRSAFGKHFVIEASSSSGPPFSIEYTAIGRTNSLDWDLKFAEGVTLGSSTQVTVTESAPEGTRINSATLPNLRVRLDKASGMVRGEAPPNSDIELTLAPANRQSVVHSIRADAGGDFEIIDPSIDMSYGINITAMNTLRNGIAAVRTYTDSNIRVGVYASQILGFIGIPVRAVDVALFDQSGAIKSNAIVQSDTLGRFTVSFEGADNPDYLGSPGPLFIEPGDRVELDWSQGDPKVIEIPELITRPNLDTNSLLGRGPAGAHVHATAALGTSHFPSSSSVDSNGDFEVSFNGVDLQRPIGGRIEFALDSGVTFMIGWAAPALEVAIERGSIRGIGPIGRVVSATLTTSSGQRIAQATIRVRTHSINNNLTEGWDLTFNDSGGSLVVPIPGDKISVDVAGDLIEMRVPRLDAFADLNTDIVRGQGDPRVKIGTTVLRRNEIASAQGVSKSTITNDDGSFQVDYSNEFDIVFNDDILLWVTDPEGHSFYHNVLLDGITMDLDSGIIRGGAPPGTTVLVSVRRDNRLLVERITGANTGGEFSVSTNLGEHVGAMLLPGDSVNVQAFPDNTRRDAPVASYSATVPRFDIEVDQATRIVRGAAPFPGRLTIVIDPLYPRGDFESPGATARGGLIIPSTEQFAFTLASLEGNSLMDLRPGQQIRVTYRGQDGHKAIRRHIVSIINFQHNGARVCGFAAPREDVSIRLLDGENEIGTAQASVSDEFRFIARLKDKAGKDVVIRQGSQLDVVIGAWAQRITVPPMDLVADWEYKRVDRGARQVRISGTISPNRMLYYQTPQDSCFYEDSASLYSGDVEITQNVGLSLLLPTRGKGVVIGHYLPSPAEHRVYRLMRRPLMRAHLNQNRIDGLVSPSSVVEVRLHDNAGVLLAVDTAVADTDGAFRISPRGQDGDEVTIRPGQEIQLRIEGTQLILRVASIDFDFDVDAGLVLSAPPNSDVVLRYTLRDGQIRQFSVKTGELGAYRFTKADVPAREKWGLSDISAIEAVLTVDDGHEIVVSYSPDPGGNNILFVPFIVRYR